MKTAGPTGTDATVPPEDPQAEKQKDEIPRLL